MMDSVITCNGKDNARAGRKVFTTREDKKEEKLFLPNVLHNVVFYVTKSCGNSI